MINLIGISYYNIGPFKDKLISIFFDKGKFLIKAPVGTGKSFLFFDGPIYALYKYTARGILNIQSKEGFVKLVFEVDGQKWLITRRITKGKSKESCTTNLYEIEGYNIESKGDIIYDKDIEDLIKQDNSIKLNEVTFKNETDLQQTLSSFLPPKEVFLNTIFLMQDSDNIFELAPADRLTVLKNVFNLLGIDDAKEKIGEKKKEIWYKLKATADTSKYDDKIKVLLGNYIGNYKELGNYELVCEVTKTQESFFQEIENYQEKININEFSAADFPIVMNDDIYGILERNKSEYQKLLHQTETFNESYKLANQKIEDSNRDKKELTANNEQLTLKINKIDPTKLLKLKEERKNSQDEQIKLENEIKNEEIENFIKNNEVLLEDFRQSKEPIQNGYLLIQYLKNKGKILNEEIKNLELKIKNEELKVRNENEKLENEIKNLNEKIEDNKKELKNIEEKIQSFEKNIDEQATFDCSKVGTNCPFIKVINKKTFEQLDKQKESLVKEKSEIEGKTKNNEEQLKIKNEELKLKDNKVDNKEFSEINSKLNNSITLIKDFLSNIDRKSVEEICEKHQLLVENEKKINQQITSLEGETAKFEEYKLQVEKNKIQIENIEKNIKDTEELKFKAENEKVKLENEIKNLNYNEILEIEKKNTSMKEIYRDINNLVNEFKDIQLQIKQLKQEEEMINNLYNIFSKELLLLVLQDHLPVLSDIINSFLSQVVDYQISFALNKTSTDKLELLAQIFDEKGERDVKSLSGGQRVILKIVWMLAISSYIHSPILFLDETINNLDGNTVGKVSEMLENFVRQRDIKLYAVTHNQQIQDMDIWDKVIELEKITVN